MRKASLLLLTLPLAVGVAYAPSVSVRAANDIEITENAYDLPGSDAPHEWIEIHNVTLAPIDLTGWKFNDGSNHLLVAPPEKGGRGSLVLAPGEYAILADDAATFLADHPSVSGAVIDTVMSLNNTADVLTMIRPDGSAVDIFSYTNTLGANGNGRTLERATDGSIHESAVDGGTPGAPNNTDETSPPPPPAQSEVEGPPPLPPPPSTDAPPPPPLNASLSATIRLSELLPNPMGNDSEKEFVELFNFGGERVVLDDWSIRDASGSKLRLNGTLDTGAYIVFTASSTNLPNLNNDGDTTELLDASGTIRDAVRYGATEEGSALARTDDGSQWKWTATLTPGAANQFATLSQSPKNTAETTQPEGSVLLVAPELSSQNSDQTKLSGNALTQSSRLKEKRSLMNAGQEETGSTLAAALREKARADPPLSSPQNISLLVAALVSALLGIAVLTLRVWQKRRGAPEFVVEKEEMS